MSLAVVVQLFYFFLHQFQPGKYDCFSTTRLHPCTEHGIQNFNVIIAKVWFWCLRAWFLRLPELNLTALILQFSAAGKFNFNTCLLHISLASAACVCVCVFTASKIATFKLLFTKIFFFLFLLLLWFYCTPARKLVVCFVVCLPQMMPKRMSQ